MIFFLAIATVFAINVQIVNNSATSAYMSIYYLSRAFPEDQFIFPYFQDVAIPQINSTDIDFDSLLSYTTTPYSFMMSYYQRIHINVDFYRALSNDSVSNITESLRYVKDICDNEVSFDFNTACRETYTQIDKVTNGYFGTDPIFPNITTTDDPPDLFFDVNVLPNDEEDLSGMIQNATDAFLHTILTIQNTSRFDDDPQNILSYPNYVLGYIPQNNTKNVFDEDTIEKRGIISSITQMIAKKVYSIKKDIILAAHITRQADTDVYERQNGMEIPYKQAMLVSLVAAKLESSKNPGLRCLSQGLQGFAKLGMTSAVLDSISVVSLYNSVKQTGSLQGAFDYYKQLTDTLEDMYKGEGDSFSKMTLPDKLSFLHNSQGIEDLAEFAVANFPQRMIESVMDDLKTMTPDKIKKYAKLKRTLKILKGLRYSSGNFNGEEMDSALTDLHTAVKDIDEDTYNEIKDVPAGTLDTISESVDDLIEAQENNPDNNVEFNETNPDDTPMQRDEEFLTGNEDSISELSEESQSITDRVENVSTALDDAIAPDSEGSEALNNNDANISDAIENVVEVAHVNVRPRVLRGLNKRSTMSRINKRSRYNRNRRLNFRARR